MKTQNLPLCTAYAEADIHGDESHKTLHGRVYLYPMTNGTLVTAEIYNLPPNSFHGFHIHDGKNCTGNANDPFANSGMHYNPTHTSHANHAGDLPALLSSDSGYAYMSVYSSRFTPKQVVGMTIVIHSDPDDYHTQPSGNSGKKIACGEIKRG